MLFIWQRFYLTPNFEKWSGTQFPSFRNTKSPVTPYDVVDLRQHWFRYRHIVHYARKHYLTQYRRNVCWGFRNKLQWYLNPISNIFVCKNACKNVFYEMGAMLLLPPCVIMEDWLITWLPCGIDGYFELIFKLIFKLRCFLCNCPRMNVFGPYRC